MSSDFHFYTDIFNQINNAVETYVTDVATNVIAAITPAVMTFVTLYVIMWGWSVIRGTINELVLDSFARLIRICLITSLALSIGNYNSYIVEFLWKSPEAMASVIVGNKSNSAQNIQYLDTQMSTIYDFGDAYYQKAQATSSYGIPDLGLLGLAYLIWFIGLATTGYAAFLLVITKLVLAAFLGIGPLCVCFMIFETTKKLFEGWLGQILTATFLTILTAAILRLVMSILESYLKAANKSEFALDPNIAAALPAIVLCVISVLVLLQLPSIAAGLGGGVAINTLNAAGWAYDKLRGTAGKAKDIASGKALSDARGARRAKDVNKKWAARNPGVAARSASAISKRISARRSNKVRKAG